MVKWWFWAFPDDDPKKWSKVIKKWSQQDLGSKSAKKMNQKIVLGQIEVAVFGRRAPF